MQVEGQDEARDGEHDEAENEKKVLINLKNFKVPVRRNLKNFRICWTLKGLKQS